MDAESAIPEVATGTEFESEAPAASESVEAPATERSYFDHTQYADAYTKVKVGGEEHEVTLAEALAGYQRQADYTQKTQEIAAQRRALAQYEGLIASLESDPQETVRALAEAYGLLGQQQMAGVSAEEDPWVDPVEQRIMQLEQTIAAQQRAQQQAELNAELAQLRHTYGDVLGDTSDDEILSYALKHRIADPEAAVRALAYERVRAEAAELRAAQDAAREQAKRQAQVVEGGHGRAAGSVAAEALPVNDIRDAFMAAKRSLGV